jgi:hypothetical protein
MRRVLLNLFLWLSIAGLAKGQDVRAEPQQIGDLLVILTGASTPLALAEGQERLDPPSDQYWLVAEVTFQNLGNIPICASFSGTLRAEHGVTGRASPLSGPGLSDLQPGEEAKARFIFTVKRGANPVELILKTADYGRDCGDKLQPWAASSVEIPIRGIASPVRAAAPAYIEELQRRAIPARQRSSGPEILYPALAERGFRGSAG